MNKKHRLTATITIICSFVFAMFAADVVLADKQKAPQKQEHVTMALDKDVVMKALASKENQLKMNETDMLAMNDESALFSKSVDVPEEPIFRGTTIDEELELFSLPYIAAELEDDELMYVTPDELQEIPDITAEDEPYDLVISKVNESLNLREEPSSDSKIVGRLYKDSYGEVLERNDDWTKISSGGVVGYANNDYLLFDDEAKEYVDSKAAHVVEVTAGSVNIRSMPGTESEILGKASSNSTFTVIEEQEEEEWFAIEYNGDVAYVNKELSESKINLGTAKSMEEIKEKERADEIAKALESAKNVIVSKASRSTVEASDEEIFLLATVIASEALSESYEGKLAVANVVVNRLLSGKWGGSITSVVYAPGQFAGSNTGRFDKFEKLVNEDCKRAAIEALAGVNNIDDFLYFISKPKANYSNYSKYYLLGNHCFYMR